MILPTTIDMLDMQHADRFTDRCPGNFGFVRAKRNFIHLVRVTEVMKDLLE